MEDKEANVEIKPSRSRQALIAKKDWRILSGSYIADKGTHEVDIQIKKGQDCSKVPGKFLAVLRAEEVI